MSAGHLAFDAERWAAFKADARPGPIHMLNLVRLHATARYPQDHPAAAERISGAEAYARYSAGSAPVFARLGGRIVWRGALELLMIGPADEQWDLCFIAEYPAPDAFVAMMRDADYRAAMIHRQAGVSDSRLIRLRPQSAGAGFGPGD